MQDNIHGRKMSTTLLWIISASTWGSDQTIRSNVQLHAARTENAVAKAPCLNPTGLYDPTKHKSILAVTYHLNRKQKSIFNKTIPCPRTVPTEHGTITKHNLQRMNARPYHTISTEERCRQYCFECISASTPKSQVYLSFWRPTSISCERVATDTSKSQNYFSFWRPTSISHESVAAD